MYIFNCDDEVMHFQLNKKIKWTAHIRIMLRVLSLNWFKYFQMFIGSFTYNNLSSILYAYIYMGSNSVNKINVKCEWLNLKK